MPRQICFPGVTTPRTPWKRDTPDSIEGKWDSMKDTMPGCHDTPDSMEKGHPGLPRGSESTINTDKTNNSKGKK